ncbi:tRNA1(Val) (adenine(37)-N6)-methyltransferase [Tianweitania aestuarii]|uniref:tRNA1(Val) (adenine(37)-N6)-methyltransferase n=1 Tax=Tianweitania aestuarii TaxID=2814886 RepID=UPI003265309E
MSDRLNWPPHTVDAFHRGVFQLVQPREQGHRAGTDALILAASVPNGFNGTVADLGAGVGAAGLAVLSRCPQAKALLVERSPDMVEWAQRTLALDANAALSTRATILQADVALTGAARRTGGLADNSVDFVILNPPFNALPDRSSPDALRAEAHVMTPDLFEQWLRTAAAIVRPKGGVAVIARPQSLFDILRAFAGRFGRAEMLPIHPRPDKPATRIVVRGELGSRAGLSLLPPLVVHDTVGNGFSERADAINNGRATLFGD